MKHLIALLWVCIAALCSPASAREWVSIDYSVPQGASGKVEGVLRKPATNANGLALLLLHHAGGFDMGTTKAYAEMFASQGFTTLELRMFDQVSNVQPLPVLHAMMASGLRYLSQQPGVQANRVSAMGLSLGAFMTIGATSTWFYEHHGLGALRFHRLAAVYPVCWMMSEAARGLTQGIRPFTGLPSSFLQSFARVPLLILAGGKDNYDGSRPEACPDFVKAIPDPEQAQLTQVKVYPEATHGWDHGTTYSFMVYGGCVGRTNCRNQNVHSPETVEKGRRDLLAFLTAP